MPFVDELKPAILVARILGIAPYAIDGVKLRISRVTILYSLIVNLLYLYSTYVTIFGSGNPDFVKNKIMTHLGVFRTVLLNTSSMISFACSLLHRRKFTAFINALNKFDTVTNLCPITKKRAVAIWVNVLLLIGLMVITRIYSEYANGDSLWSMWDRLGYFTICADINQHTVMVFSILRRFQYMKRIIEQGPKDLVVTRQFLRKTIGLREVWILYEELIDATEKLNSFFSIQLLIWICFLPINIVTRMYDMWKKGLQNTHINKIVMNSTITIVYTLLLISFTGICHVTASATNNLRATVFRINSKILQSNHNWGNEDTFSIGQFFVLRRFHFTAAGGFVRIDLLLLQAIAAAITTYVVLLKSPSEIANNCKDIG